MSRQQPTRSRVTWASIKVSVMIAFVLVAAAVTIWALFTTHATTFARGPE